MTIQECYNKLGGNYDEVLGRLKAPVLIERFALKFLDDKSFLELTEALTAEDLNSSFSAAHTLKGVSANLSFSKLFKVSSEITEFLRAGNLSDAKEVYPRLNEAYQVTVSALIEYKQSK